MSGFVARRLLIGVATLLLASMIVFAVLEILPGDPAMVMLGIPPRTSIGFFAAFRS